MATGAPGTNGVWQYGEDDSEATFSALLNKAAATTDTQIGLDRGRLTTLEARKLSGIVPIIPTGVAVGSGSGSYNATTGLVTFTNANAVTVNGVFSGTYTNYKIVLYSSTGSTGAAVTYRFAQAGTGTTAGAWFGAGYYYGVSGSGVLSTFASAADFYLLGLTGTGSFSQNATNAEIQISQSRVNVFAGGFPNGAGGNTCTAAWQGSTSSYDGFKLNVSGGATFTGTMKVYGWN